MKSLFGGEICLLDMEGKEEYLETDVRKGVLHNLKHLGLDAELAASNPNVEKPPYTGGFFVGNVFRMVDNMGTIKVKGQNFDYVHIVRRG